MPLTTAQEIVAVEAGFEDWSALKVAAEIEPVSTRAEGDPKLLGTVPLIITNANAATSSTVGKRCSHAKP